MPSRLSLIILIFSVLTTRGDEPSVDFQRQIRPILSDKCFQCHGPDDQHRKAGLRLDIESQAKGKRKNRVAIVPNDLRQSSLVQRIESEDHSERMPPPDSGKQLTEAEIQLLKRWISQGAHWGDHWAYVPPKKADKLVTIDGYLIARLQREKLTQSPPADTVTLMRRLHFDLIGLPPTPDEVNRYRPAMYEQIVDRLLERPEYGERLASYWLDLVRYADTVGYHGDQDHHATPYRDYVIDSFNQNIPFNQFTIEQIAGDLLPNSGIDQKIATCYNRLLQTSHEGGVQPKEYLAIYAADRVRNVSTVWMGATLGCAQCHNHKYDPYTIKDFYAFAAFFADVDEEKHLRGGGSDTVPTKRPPEIIVHTRLQRERLAALEEVIRTNEREFKNATPEARTQLERQIRQARSDKLQLEKNSRKVMVTQAVTPRITRILPRGNWLDDSGPVVEPAVPEFLGKLSVTGRRANRLDLARWLTDEKQGIGGLTARVFVNRLWALFFGQGLCRSLEDFGNQGSAPDHPELLDHLANDFIESGWNVKKLIKQIVMSKTYQQSSNYRLELKDRDPENTLLARQSKFRLPAEMVRDNALLVSGLLVLEREGKSIKPYQPAGYYRHLNFPKREYHPDLNQQQFRRGVYVHWQRQFLHPMMKAFDAPSREECTVQRQRSNTPQAALVLLNDPTFLEAARHFAQKILSHDQPDNKSRIQHAFNKALNRQPDDAEQTILLDMLSNSKREFRTNPEATRKLITVGLTKPDATFDPIELASWMMVSRAIFNLSEMVTRN